MASPTSVLSTDMKRSGLDLKNEGNAHFMKRRFTDALSCYSEGIAVVTQADEDLEAILYSNRSGCYYEMGNYENAAADARKCSQLLMESMAMKIKAAHDRGEPGKDIKMPPLVWKNMYRLARSLHFGNAEDAEVHYPLHLIEKQLEESREYGPMATKMREQLNYYLRMPSNNEKFEPSLLRASFQNPYVEYYNFGHDESESLLRRNEGSNAESILLDELDDEELSSLSFLFGGVGDGRHAFATLLDANHQYQSLSEMKQDKFRLHMTLNDISAQLLAKDVLVLVLSYELGGAADSAKTALTTADPFNIGMVIYYVTLGYAMPPFVHRKMVEHIKRWFTDSTFEDFQQTFPWLVISEDTWTGIITIMNAWVEPEAHYSPEFPSAMEVLPSYRPNGDDRVDNAMAGLSSMGAGNELIGDMKAKLDSAREQKRAQVAEAFKSMDLTPDMIEKAKYALGEDATEKEMRNFLVEIVLDQMLDGGPPRYVSPMDKLFLEQTKCLNPEAGPSDEMKEETSSFVIGKNGSSPARGSSKEEAIEAINKYKPHVGKNWVTNPVQIDPSYWYFSDGNRATDEFNPVKEFPQGFLTQDVISFMSEPPPDILSAKTDEEKEKVFKSNTLASNVIRYYWHVGRAVTNLLGKTVIEIALGSIVAFGDASSDREGKALPSKYHRITLSNIPDYTGMHSVFITVAPLLSLKSKSVTPCIQSNCLLNTGLWKSYDDYFFSTTALGYKEAEAVFRLRVADQEPSIWGTNVWEQVDDDDERVESLSLSHEELRTWLHRLFLMTVVPADRDVNSMLREEKASNINTFLLTLSHCVNLGMSAHFIASVLEDLLKKKTLVTKATLSNESPALYLDSKDVSKKRFALSAFHTELANQTAIFLQNSILGFRLLDTSVLPTQKASLYELKLGGISPKYEQSWTYEYGSVSSAMSLGFMLQKTKVRGEYDISTAARNNNNGNHMFMMMAMMQGGGMPGSQKKPSKLRRDLLSSGDEIGHVFSCMNWDLANQTASFWMCEDVFEKFSDYHFRLIRTDGWFCLPHGDAKLGDAKHIG